VFFPRYPDEITKSNIEISTLPSLAAHRSQPVARPFPCFVRAARGDLPDGRGNEIVVICAANKHLRQLEFEKLNFAEFARTSPPAAASGQPEPAARLIQFCNRNTSPPAAEFKRQRAGKSDCHRPICFESRSPEHRIRSQSRLPEKRFGSFHFISERKQFSAIIQRVSDRVCRQSCPAMGSRYFGHRNRSCLTSETGTASSLLLKRRRE